MLCLNTKNLFVPNAAKDELYVRKEKLKNRIFLNVLINAVGI